MCHLKNKTLKLKLISDDAITKIDNRIQAQNTANDPAMRVPPSKV